jgi:hypothetical protein
MNHTDRTAYAEAFKRKAKGYDIGTCRRAIEDIDSTLLIHECRQTVNEPSDYVTRLWLERDAMLDRQSDICRQIRRDLDAERQAEHESRWHTSASGQPLDTEE